MHSRQFDMVLVDLTQLQCTECGHELEMNKCKARLGLVTSIKLTWQPCTQRRHMLPSVVSEPSPQESFDSTATLCPFRYSFIHLISSPEVTARCLAREQVKITDCHKRTVMEEVLGRHVAQLVEQLSVNPVVSGATPSSSWPHFSVIIIIQIPYLQ